MKDLAVRDAGATMPHKILVVDDDKQIVRLVTAYLTQAGYDVVTAYDGESALHVMRHERPDLLVLDLLLPGKDGWEVTRAIRNDRQLAATPIVMLTARVEDADKIVGLELGADDYMTKPFNPREVLARVKAVLRRTEGAVAHDRILKVPGLTLDPVRHEVTAEGKLVELTPTEFEMLRMFLESAGRVLTRTQLLEATTEGSFEGLERTVDSHIKNLRRKVDPGSARIETVYGVGYRLNDDQASPS
jgi:two-component system alkaline phosphatase synthesis response regulator PhoP